MATPDKLWAFWANGYGSIYKDARKVKKKTTSFGPLWWDENGDNEIEIEGLNEGEYSFAYAHRDKSKVDQFIKGFNAARRLMANFCNEE